MHIIKKLVLSVVITSLIASPVAHANDVTSLWNKPEHKVWIISGAAVCVALLAVLAWYKFSTNEKKITPSSSINVPPVTIQALDAAVPVQVKVDSPVKSYEQPEPVFDEQSVSSSEQDVLLPHLSPREVDLGDLGDDSESDEEANRIRKKRMLKQKSEKISKKHENKAKKIEHEVDNLLESFKAIEQEGESEAPVPVKKNKKFAFSDSHQNLSAQGKLAISRDL